MPGLHVKTGWVDCITINLSPATDPPTCQTSTQVLYTVALNSSVVLTCEMSAHPGAEEVTFSWSGNTSLITRHVVNMAASRSTVRHLGVISCQAPGFCQSARFPSQKLRTIGTGVWVMTGRPWPSQYPEVGVPCPHSIKDNAVWLWLMMPRSLPLIGHYGLLLTSDWSL